ncbi:hypothetical protein QZH41_004753 [Actinostola sp. cb2023]|nr:hypothetical protein QZH41_004753 [Actinostola sp. cb2023]
MADWQHGLCGCFNDCGTCIVTFIAPCYTHGKNAEAVGESCLLCGLSVLVPVLDIFTMASIRTIVREQHGIAGSMANDFLATFFCSCCSIIQRMHPMPAAKIITEGSNHMVYQHKISHSRLLSSQTLLEEASQTLQDMRSDPNPSQDDDSKDSTPSRVGWSGRVIGAVVGLMTALVATGLAFIWGDQA